MADPKWRVELFSQLCVFRHGERMPNFGTRRVQLLLAYLAILPKRPHPREELVEAIWPDSDWELGRNRLSNALSMLRSFLEPTGTARGTVLCTSSAGVLLMPETVATDVAEFEAARVVARRMHPRAAITYLENAAKLYQGELLPGYYEDWVEAARQRLDTAYQEVLHRLIQTFAEQGNLDQAIYYAERGVAVNPFWEEAHLALINLYAAAGLPSVALRQYEALLRVYKELGDTPPPFVRDLLDQLRRTQSIPKPPAAFQALSDVPTVPSGFKKSLEISNNFWGREKDFTELLSLLLSGGVAPNLGMLVTLVGLAGTGKTRLAMELTQALRASFGPRVWFIPLAGLTEANQIGSAISEAMQLKGSPNDLLERCVQALGCEPAVLVLDNFEHLLEAGASLLKDILSRVPTLTCLVTSRRRLGVDRECEVLVEPLPVPLEEAAQPIDELMNCPSVQLFVSRAQAARRGFVLTAENSEAIASLCRQLEGLPLALELAAAWARVLTPAQTCKRLTRRLDLLVSREPGAYPHQASLRASLAWSWHLLGPGSQGLLATLSIFRGGWTLEAAEAIGADPLALEHLTQLHEHLLIASTENGAEMRFSMLETIREFASEQLAVDSAETVANRHAAYCLACAEEATPHLSGPSQDVWLKRLATETDNMRAALNWYAQTSPEEGLRLAVALSEFWLRRGDFQEGRRQLNTLMQPGKVTHLQAKALAAAGNLACNQGDYSAAQVLYQECRAIGESLGDKAITSSSLNNLGLVAQHFGQPDKARLLYAESLKIDRERGDALGVAKSLHNLGVFAYAEGDYPVAQQLWEEASGEYRRLGDALGEANALNNVGLAVRDQGHYNEARSLFEQVLQVARHFANDQLLSYAFNNLGMVADYQGDLDAAQDLYEQSLVLKRKLGLEKGISVTLSNLGTIRRKRGDFVGAQSSLQEGLNIRWKSQDRKGIARDLEEFGLLALACGDKAEALRRFGCAEALRIEIKFPRALPDCRDVNRELAALEAEIGKDNFAQLQAVGRATALVVTVQDCLKIGLPWPKS